MSSEVAVVRYVSALPRAFGSGSSRVGVFPGEWEQQQVVISCNALFFEDLWGPLRLQMEPVHRPLMVAVHAPLWFLRFLLWFVPATCRSRKRFCLVLSALLLLAHTRAAQPPIAYTRGTWSPIALASGVLPPQPEPEAPHPLNVHTCAGREIPMVVCPSSTCPPQQQHLASPMGPNRLPGFLHYGAQLPSLWHTTPKPLRLSPETALVHSQELTSQAWVSHPAPTQVSHAVVSGAVVQMICAALTQLYPPQSSCCNFLSNFDVSPSRFISSLVRWLPRVWVPFLFNSSLLGVLVPSHSPSLSLFFLLFYPVI